jgi:hypothetical protein
MDCKNFVETNALAYFEEARVRKKKVLKLAEGGVGGGGGEASPISG